MKLPFKTTDQVNVTFKDEHVLLVTMNRPNQRNAMSIELEDDLNRIFDWFEQEPSLWVAIITGKGKAFCAGADLKCLALCHARRCRRAEPYA
jgi:enoyl-CoA hydratase/carnithine racemase